MGSDSRITVHNISRKYYYTRGSRIRYTGPPGFFAEVEEATGATEAVLGLPRVGGTAALGATLPKWGFSSLKSHLRR